MDCTAGPDVNRAGCLDPGMLLSVAVLKPLLGFEQILVHCFNLDRHKSLRQWA